MGPETSFRTRVASLLYEPIFMLKQLFDAGGTESLLFSRVFLFLKSDSALSSEQNGENVLTYLQVNVYDMQSLSSLSI